MPPWRGACAKPSSRTRSSTRRSSSRASTSSSTTTASPTRSSRRAARAPTSSPSRSPRRRASSSSSAPSGPTTGCARTTTSTRCARPSATGAARDYPGVTRTTRRLLEYWQRPDRDRRLFFCQLEAVETAIYLTECVAQGGQARTCSTSSSEANEAANPGLDRMAFKMATGSGKTVVMAMLIAWHALNKIETPQDARFSDSFLIVAPGITIRDRLRVLLPNDGGNYYRALDVVPAELMERLNRATDRDHQLPRLPAAREGLGRQADQAHPRRPRRRRRRAPSPRRPTRWCAACAASSAARRTSSSSTTRRTTATAASRRSRREARPATARSRATTRKEAQKRDEEARVWISGLEAIKRKIGIRAIYDLSATPFFLRGSGYAEGTLFPWVVSDFSLVDAIECGIVKVPRVPVADNSMTAMIPMYRHLWPHVKDALPKKGRKTDDVAGGMPKLPKELEAALLQPLRQLREVLRGLDARRRGGRRGQPPHAAGVHRRLQQHQRLQAGLRLDRRLGADGRRGRRRQAVVAPGNLKLFSNVAFGQWTDRPNTILIDSAQLESGEQLSAEFKKVVAREIEEFKAEYRQRFPERDAEAITDEDLLREVMNTVGKPGRLGEQIKCVVSVSMLTEGWDANTVTHVLGIRAFSTQLLCEQVVGRALRRTTYVTDARRPVPGRSTPRCTGCRSRSSRWGRRSARRCCQRRQRGCGRCPSASPTSSPSRGSPATATSWPASACGCEFDESAGMSLSHGRRADQGRGGPAHRPRQHPHARPAQGAARAGGRLPARQAGLRDVLPRGRRGRRAGEQALALPADPRGGARLAPAVPHLQGRLLPADAAARGVRAHRRRQDLPGDRRLHARRAEAAADPAALRHRWAPPATSTSTPRGRCGRPTPTSATSRTWSATPTRGSRRWRRRWRTWTRSRAT